MKSITFLLVKICLLGVLLNLSTFSVKAGLSKLKAKVKAQSSVQVKDVELLKQLDSLFSINKCEPSEKKDGEDVDKDKTVNESVGVGHGWTIPKSKHNKYK